MPKQISSKWKLIKATENSSAKLEREYKFKNWLEALDFINKVSEIAEQQNHHPYIEMTWGYVKILFWSHDVASITERDYQAAAAVDALLQ